MKLNRLIAILSVLLNQEQVTAPELAKRQRQGIIDIRHRNWQNVLKYPAVQSTGILKR